MKGEREEEYERRGGFGVLCLVGLISASGVGEGGCLGTLFWFEGHTLRNRCTQFLSFVIAGFQR